MTDTPVGGEVLLSERVKDRLTDQDLDPERVVNVYVTTAPTPPGRRYVVLYPDPGRSRPAKVAAVHTDHVDRIAVMTVSDTTDGVQRLTAWVRNRLTGWCPNPEDRSQGPLTETDAGPLLPDRDNTILRFSQTIFYRASRRRKQPLS